MDFHHDYMTLAIGMQMRRHVHDRQWHHLPVRTVGGELLEQRIGGLQAKGETFLLHSDQQVTQSACAFS